MTRSDIVLVERVAVLARLVERLAASGVAGEPACPYGPCQGCRDCAREDHGGGVFFSPPERGVSGPFMGIVDARWLGRRRQKVPLPRRVRWEDACLSTGIAGEGFEKAKQAHRKCLRQGQNR